MAEKTLREKLETRIMGMKGVRAPYEPDYEEIARLSLPSRSSLMKGNAGNKRRANTAMHDTAGRLAGRKLTNGMAQGMSPSSSPWFKLATSDRDMMEYQPVKEWLEHEELGIYQLFSQTNYYDAAKVAYSELGHMGIGAKIGLEHDDYLAVWHPLTVGEYWVALDDGLRVSTLVRRTYPTVDQLMRNVRDKAKLSRQVNDAYDKGNIHFVVPCWHVIEQNNDRFGEGIGVTAKPWRSIKWEEGQQDKNILLSVSGYDSKPFTAPRWETIGNQVYCDSSPGFDALPDLRELQMAARRQMRAMDMLVKPPMRAPSGLARTGLSLDPGTVSYFDAVSDNQVGPLVQPDYRSIEAIRNQSEFLTNRVNELFYADLFMAISEMEGVQPRNELELDFRNEEKLTQLGPVVDRVNVEMLEVDIDRAFTIRKNLGLVQPMPREMEGQALTIEFISILAQAQRAARNSAIERAARFVGFVAGLFPDAAIKFDAEQAIDEFATNSGASPKIIRSDEIVAKMKEQMAQQQAAAQAAQMAAPAKDAATAAELLSRTKVEAGDGSMLSNMVAQ